MYIGGRLMYIGGRLMYIGSQYGCTCVDCGNIDEKMKGMRL